MISPTNPPSIPVRWHASESYYQIASIGETGMLEPKTREFIIVARDIGRLKTRINLIGAQVGTELGLINAVSATLTRKQLGQLRRDSNIRTIVRNETLYTAGKVLNEGTGSQPQQGRHRQTFFPRLIDADILHEEGVTGQGIGVAVIYTGIWENQALNRNTNGDKRIVAYYDAIQNRTTLPLSDENGHGSHIASVVASSEPSIDEERNATGSYHGVAPDANLVIVKAFDEQGRGNYMNVIRGIGYVIAHKEEHNIRVLNLSFSGTPMSHYWQDPLNLAVMAAWRAG
ncbi:MAG: S8 family serine peptidase, partial [Pseudohongiellaceae bacterium]